MATSTLTERRYDRNRRGAWGLTLTCGAAVSTLHFAGLAYDIYTELWWWDVLTHTTSGFGVAAILYLLSAELRLGLFRNRFGLFVLLPVCVLAIGAWFEVYERVFKDFWFRWSLAYYWDDTFKDLVADTLGAVAFGVVFRAYKRSRDWMRV